MELVHEERTGDKLLHFCVDIHVCVCFVMDLVKC